MTDERNQNWKEHKNQTPQQNNEARGSKEETSNQQTPGNRLKDGTNDFQNGDQNETSESSSTSDRQGKV